MCFSATASFITVAVTGAAGILALSRVDRREDMALAATPLFFAAQQAVEGALWIQLPKAPEGPAVATLTLTFLMFAKVFWPAFVPATIFLVEPDAARRRLLAAFVAAGALVALYFANSVTSHALTARLAENHIAYSGEPAAPLPMQIAYFAVTGLPAALSTLRTLRLFGAIVLAGSLVSYFFYFEAFSSVWCFFAAAASAVIALHFEKVRSARLARG